MSEIFRFVDSRIEGSLEAIALASTPPPPPPPPHTHTHTPSSHDTYVEVQLKVKYNHTYKFDSTVKNSLSEAKPHSTAPNADYIVISSWKA